MTWREPFTWTDGDTATEDIFNRDLRDNVNHLLTRPYVYALSTSTFTTTSASYVPVNAVFTLAMVTGGGHILVGVYGGYLEHGAGIPDFAIGMDGGSEQVVERINLGGGRNLKHAVVFTGLSAAQHTPTLRWRQNGGGTATLRGADSGGVAIPPIIFWAIEI